MSDPHYEARPGFTPRAADTASGPGIAEAFAELVGRVGDAIDEAKAPGKPLDRLAGLTRKAPLTTLAVAFLLGVVTTRRR